MRTLIAIGLVLLAAATSHGATVIFNDFSDTSLLTLNGWAATTTTGDGTVLRLTPAAASRSGSAFSTATVRTATFSTYFQFRITEPGGTLFDGNTETGADGIVFVVQSVSSSIGGAGQGIGYAGISPSLGIEIDTWHNSANNDPNSNHLGIDLNGVVDHGAGAPYTTNIATRFDDGNMWHVWVDYDGTTVEVRANQTGVRSAAALLSRDVDLYALLGDLEDAYIGFTSGTGADWGNHDIVYWEYRDNYDPINSEVPEPATLAIWGVLGGLGLVAARRRKSVG